MDISEIESKHAKMKKKKKYLTEINKKMQLNQSVKINLAFKQEKKIKKCKEFAAVIVECLCVAKQQQVIDAEI